MEHASEGISNMVEGVKKAKEMHATHADTVRVLTVSHIPNVHNQHTYQNEHSSGKITNITKCEKQAHTDTVQLQTILQLPQIPAGQGARPKFNWKAISWEEEDDDDI